MSEYDLRIAFRRDEIKRQEASLRYVDGFVPDLPHRFTPGGFQESSGLCLVCGGHSDRRIHDKPWYRPVFGPCRTCQDRGDIECDVCAETRRSFNRIGIEPFLEPPERKAYRRAWMPGHKISRRKHHWNRRISPQDDRRLTKAHLKEML